MLPPISATTLRPVILRPSAESWSHTHLSQKTQPLQFRLVLFFGAITLLTLLTALQNSFEIVRFSNAFNKKMKQLENDKNN